MPFPYESLVVLVEKHGFSSQTSTITIIRVHCSAVHIFSVYRCSVLLPPTEEEIKFILQKARVASREEETTGFISEFLVGTLISQMVTTLKNMFPTKKTEES